LPSEIEFVAKRKRVKFGSVPSRFCTCSSENQENYRKLRKKQNYKSCPYQRERKQNDYCVLHLARDIKKNEVSDDKQKDLIEVIRRENDTLRTIVSLLQNILQNRKQ